jgi:hypothetical protein
LLSCHPFADTVWSAAHTTQFTSIGWKCVAALLCLLLCGPHLIVLSSLYPSPSVCISLNLSQSLSISLNLFQSLSISLSISLSLSDTFRRTRAAAFSRRRQASSATPSAILPIQFALSSSSLVFSLISSAVFSHLTLCECLPALCVHCYCLLFVLLFSTLLSDFCYHTRVYRSSCTDICMLFPFSSFPLS